MLSFNETALCNILFSSQNKDDVYANIGGVVEMSTSISLREILSNFHKRVMNLDSKGYQEIVKRRNMEALFSFPPVVL